LFVSWSAQLRLLLEAMGQGVVLALVWEGGRILRRLLPHGALAVAVEDMLFCCFAALWAFGFFLRVSEGRPRAFLLLGMAGGAAAYFCSVGRLLRRVFARIGRRNTPHVRDRQKNRDFL